ncbi:peptidoglycan-binding protein [Vibrio europaeus]|uniref:peptidoglycan-binding protein n=1 Tax=Vibrio europaeus TaxID=300876 RepID=UPI00148CE2A1|nr:peptidoglycan-binding protein [Vibrio europaeus]NOH22498.1 peptidoglycan-binding protein [Vibrio europaeus]
MINGIWTSGTFKANSRSKSIFGRRKGLLTEIDKLLEKAHVSSDDEALLPHLYAIDKACQAWLDAHPLTASKPEKGKKLSARRQGIEALREQISKKRAELYKIPQSALNQRKAITDLYESSTTQLNVAPGGQDPRTLKARAAFHQEMLDKTIEQAIKLGHDKNAFNTEQLGFLSAKSCLKVDSVLDPSKKKACYIEAIRILTAMLGKNSELAKRFESTGIEVVVVPADRPMTDLPEFASLKGVGIAQQSSSVSRGWDSTRGVGGLQIGAKMYVAITEENLLGTDVDAKLKTIGGGCYASQYSTSSHEFAHSLHLSDATTLAQKQAITRSFNNKKKVQIETANTRIIIDDPLFVPAQHTLDALFSQEWVDGPRRSLTRLPTPKQYWVWVTKHHAYATNPDGSHLMYTSYYELQDCYAAFDEREYFAQCTNAYLGANSGSDPYTQRPRNNGEAWIRKHEEPEMVKLLDELYSSGTTTAFSQSHLEGTNRDDGVDVTTISDYIKAHVAKAKTNPTV